MRLPPFIAENGPVREARFADIKTAIASVPGAVNNDAGAEAALRAAHLDIINAIENDAILQTLSIKEGNPGFNFAPPELATPQNAKTPHATFAELGAIFDDAQSAVEFASISALQARASFTWARSVKPVEGLVASLPRRRTSPRSFV
jgi:hypothetical protein